MRQTLQEHALLLGLVCAYIAGAGVFLLLIGAGALWGLRAFYLSFTALFVLASVIRLIAVPGSRRFDHIAGAVLVGLIAAPFQSTFNSVKQGAGVAYGFTWDARLADIDVKTVRRIMNARNVEGVAIICKAARFDRSTFSAIVFFLDPSPKRSVQSANDLVALYDKVTPESAQRVIRFWRVRKEANETPSAPTIARAS